MKWSRKGLIFLSQLPKRALASLNKKKKIYKNKKKAAATTERSRQTTFISRINENEIFALWIEEFSLNVMCIKSYKTNDDQSWNFFFYLFVFSFYRSRDFTFDYLLRLSWGWLKKWWRLRGCRYERSKLVDSYRQNLSTHRLPFRFLHE